MSELPEGAKPRPAPIPDAESAAFWAGTVDGTLLVQECSVCGQRQLYGRSLCTNCHAAALTWVPTNGMGTIYSRTIIRQNPSRSFRPMIPFVVALIDLDDGPRLMSNVIGTPAEDVHIGDRVRVLFEKVSDEASLPLFEVVRP